MWQGECLYRILQPELESLSRPSHLFSEGLLLCHGLRCGLLSFRFSDQPRQLCAVAIVPADSKKSCTIKLVDRYRHSCSLML